MLKVYAAQWCPHCGKTLEFLRNNKIEFEYYEIEEQNDETIRKIEEVNGGDDWKVPTLEYDGHWREGKVFDEVSLRRDLTAMGVFK